MHGARPGDVTKGQKNACSPIDKPRQRNTFQAPTLHILIKPKGGRTTPCRSGRLSHSHATNAVGQSCFCDAGTFCSLRTAHAGTGMQGKAPSPTLSGTLASRIPLHGWFCSMARACTLKAERQERSRGKLGHQMMDFSH